ncbi:development-specific protein LVN1.2-like [Amphiura filiformis]|uniref:development-specific protein LVN1.2-like n=1 Tax=Amphiura filiformis TaxID=82378 RepID=UPI003B2238EA
MSTAHCQKWGILWTINGLKCVKAQLGGKLTESCVPDDANYDGADRAAFAQIPLEVGTWSWWEPENNGNYLVGNISVTHLLYDCRPVQEMFFGRSKYDGKYYYTALSGTFHNYQYGIMNPDKYFTVPQFCPKEFSSEAPGWPIELNSASHYRPFSPIDLLHRDFNDLSSWPRTPVE